MVRVKICCISSVDELNLAVQYGASAVGLVSEMPSGPGVIPDELISEIAAHVPPGVSSFLLTCRQDAETIIQQQRKLRTGTIQLCDRLSKETLNEIKRKLPGINIVQVVHVNGEDSIEEAKNISEHVDAILLDSGNQNLPVKLLGGTGKKHNWEISKKIVEEVSVPVYLAGGLNEANAAEAITSVKPFGLDICSGVRLNGKLDEKKLSAFFNEVRKFF